MLNQGQIRATIASIATNDPENDPTPRVRLERHKVANRYVWLDPDGNEVADGKTAKEASIALAWVYNFPAWDLRFGS